VNRKRNWIAVGVSIALFVAGSIVADAGSPWEKQLDESAALLQSSHYQKAGALIDHTIAGMSERLGGGETEERMFSIALVQKALASAGNGDVDDALWYWSVAQELSPAAAKFDVTKFGVAGEYLALHPPAKADVTAPVRSLKVVKEVLPKFPRGASRYGFGGDLVVQIVVDRSGRPTLPRIVHGLPAPALSYAALEALRQWRFEPAKNNGETVPAVFNLTVHYKL